MHAARKLREQKAIRSERLFILWARIRGVDKRIHQGVYRIEAGETTVVGVNAFTEGGYLGMLLLVEAMEKVGPELTRERLKLVLDHMSLNTGLTLQDRISFTPTSRFSNITMQAFVIQYKGSFGGWRAGPIVRDPRL